MIRGVDISNYQNNPDFNAIKSSGVEFVIIKTTEGIGFTDPTFLSNQTAIRNTGLGLGYYHFARPDLGNTPEEEADYFCSVLTLTSGEVLALDYEVNYSDPVGWCKAFLDRVKTKFGCNPLIYLNLTLVRGYDWAPVINAGYGLWLADYDGIDNNTPDTPWPLVAMKQWSSTGQVPGIVGNTDLDTFFGDLNTLKAYGYHDFMTPTPVPSIPMIIDQTHIPIGGTWGEPELQAVRSLLNDQASDILRLEKDKENLNIGLTNIQIKLAEALKQLQNTPVVDPAINIFQAPLSTLFKELLRRLRGS